MGNLKKVFLVSFGIISILVILIILCASPIAKYLIQKYDVQFTGREITVDWVYLNPFTGYIHLDDLKIYEHNSEEEFFTSKGLSANFAMLKLLSRSYEISEVTLNKPRGNVLRYVKDFNFSDLIEKFRPKEKSTPKGEPIRFSVLNIAVKDGEFHYDEQQTPVNYYVKNVNIESQGWSYDVDTMPILFSFSSGVGSGDVDGVFTIDLDKSSYKLDVKVDSFNLEIINQYLKDIVNYGTFAAHLDADLKTTGHFSSVDSITAKGNIVVSRFHFGKTKDEDFTSFDNLVIQIKDLSPKDLIYDFDSISLNKPFIKYELYDYLDNIQTMFGAGGENVAEVNADPNKFNLVIEIAKLVEQLSKNFLRSQYKVGRVAVYNGDIQFRDYSIGERFTMGLKPFSVEADSIDKKHKRVEVKVKSAIQPYGNFFVSVSVDPNDTTFFDMSYKFQKIPLTMFNPYISAFTSFPLDRGAIEINGTWNVRDGIIDSRNHLIILDPRVNDKVKNNDNKWIPVPLAMALVRERGNVIDYEIPITGNLKSPSFNVWDVVFDILKNIVIKPVTTPYRMEVKSVEKSLEKSLAMKWNMQSSELSSSHEKFIKKIVEFLKDNPEAQISISPKNYALKEKEFILYFEAKKKYYLSKHGESTVLSDKDSVDLARMSIKDNSFVSYLNTQVQDSMLFTIHHKTDRLIDAAVINQRYDELNAARQLAFLEPFKEDKVEGQIKFLQGEAVIPFNGFTFYSIGYEGEFPQYLMEAFDKMNEFDGERPREQYKDKREKNVIEK
jgi:hypothetical protein